MFKLLLFFICLLPYFQSALQSLQCSSNQHVFCFLFISFICKPISSSSLFRRIVISTNYFLVLAINVTLSAKAIHWCILFIIVSLLLILYYLMMLSKTELNNIDDGGSPCFKQLLTKFVKILLMFLLGILDL